MREKILFFRRPRWSYVWNIAGSSQWRQMPTWAFVVFPEFYSEWKESAKPTTENYPDLKTKLKPANRRFIKTNKPENNNAKLEKINGKYFLKYIKFTTFSY